MSKPFLHNKRLFCRFASISRSLLHMAAAASASAASSDATLPPITHAGTVLTLRSGSSRVAIDIAAVLLVQLRVRESKMVYIFVNGKSISTSVAEGVVSTRLPYLVLHSMGVSSRDLALETPWRPSGGATLTRHGHVLVAGSDTNGWDFVNMRNVGCVQTNRTSEGVLQVKLQSLGTTEFNFQAETEEVQTLIFEDVARCLALARSPHLAAPTPSP